MKAIRAYNRLLLILALLFGVSVGVSGALTIVLLSSYEKIFLFVLLGLIVLSTVLALLLVAFTYKRSKKIALFNEKIALFGEEVPFKDEDAFIKEAATSKVKKIYALRLILPESLSDSFRKQCRYALCAAVNEVFEGKATIGTGEGGEILFLGLSSEGSFLDLAETLNGVLLAKEDMPPFALLLGASLSGEAEELVFQAKEATNIDQYTRDSLSFLTYSAQEEKEKGIDFALEKEQGRLSYGILPFGVRGIGENKETQIALLTPMLYDAYRGNLVNKDLYHSLQLTSSRKGLDLDASKMALRVLAEQPRIHTLGLFLGEEALLDANYLPSLTEEAKKYGLDLKRLCFFVPGLSLGKKGIVDFALKAKGLGAKMGVYEYGGESVEHLIKVQAEVATLKPELLRKGADEAYLGKIIDVLHGLKISVLIAEKEESDIPSEPAFRYPRKEEEA